MARENSHISCSFSLRYICHFTLLISVLSFVSFLFRHNTTLCSFPYDHNPNADHSFDQETIDLLTFSSAWNHLTFSSSKPNKILKIAVVVKKWPQKSQAGGLERHALTLHLALANRGHEVHVFTAESSSFPEYGLKNLRFHLSKPTSGGYLDQASISQELQTQNASVRPFDVVHTESVGLLHTRAKNLRNVVASWHGIAYETFHSDIIQELLRQADIAAAVASGTQEEQPPPSSPALTERAKRVVDEVKFFQRYAHHVATSDHCGDVLKRIYMIPEERVHIILNGVDESVFKPDVSKRERFRERVGVRSGGKNGEPPLVLGIAGRLVRDKGHPLMFSALKRVFEENKKARENVVVLVAGDGPWGNRYRDLGSSNVIVLGPLDQEKLAEFYNAIDVFVNPTLRAQGLDHTLLEAMVSGKPVLATRLASITGSVVVGPHLGYTFSPNVDSLVEAISRVVSDGTEELERKGKEARKRSLRLFTASKMADAYERLFLCISDKKYCIIQA
ncbi:unnamed protein product [Eruca vesicaria subsp. sativa]|uniref:Glycosyltransferase subfamily 4-like N-terminal domain-containing protein n=1 Tax=Eruca vesicaria subsp. sativa TaxID=29727 RepID=A0ABC8IRW5_ERUVS|nr:unnamed protein product [Eruca vesicaria subsp. sativa]